MKIELGVVVAQREALIRLPVYRKPKGESADLFGGLISQYRYAKETSWHYCSEKVYDQAKERKR